MGIPICTMAYGHATQQILHDIAVSREDKQRQDGYQHLLLYRVQMQQISLVYNIEMEQKNTLQLNNGLLLLAKTAENNLNEARQALLSLKTGCFSTLFRAIDSHGQNRITLHDISQYCAVENITPFAAMFLFTEEDHITEPLFVQSIRGKMEENNNQEKMSLTETAYLFVRFIQMLARNQEKIAAVKENMKWEDVKEIEEYFYSVYGVEQLTEESLKEYLRDNGINSEEIAREIVKEEEIEWKDLFPVCWEKEEKEEKEQKEQKEQKGDDIMVQIEHIEQMLREKKNNMTNRFREIEETQEGVFIPTTQDKKYDIESHEYIKRSQTCNSLKKSSSNVALRSSNLQKKLNEIQNNINYSQLLSRRQNNEFLRKKYHKKYEEPTLNQRTRLATSTMMRLKEIEDSSKQSYYLSTRNYQRRINDALENNYNDYQATGIRLKTSGPIYGIKAERKVQWYLSARRRFM